MATLKNDKIKKRKKPIERQELEGNRTKKIIHRPRTPALHLKVRKRKEEKKVKVVLGRGTRVPRDGEATAFESTPVFVF